MLSSVPMGSAEVTSSNALPESSAPFNLSSMLLAGAGVVIILLAAVSFITDLSLQGIFAWLERVFSMAFIVIFSSLSIIGLFAVQKIQNNCQADYWYEVAQQSGNGISTLALTFTLLGISLGIGTISDQPLTPENVQVIISGLTKQFSMAFMTTVVGLPAATIVRALSGIKYQRIALPNKGQAK